jgi:predicted kinase
MPVGPSGTGKSTFLNKLKERSPNIVVFSLDALRHEFYHPTDYAIAYQKSVDDPKFFARSQQRFRELAKMSIEQQLDLYVDNTNLSRKTRKWYLDLVRGHMRTVAVRFNTDLETMLARQKTRGDKCVPEAAVRQQFASMQEPTIEEFDETITVL